MTSPKMNTEEILSNFVERLPRPVVKMKLKKASVVPSFIKKLPVCLLRVAKFHGGFLLLSCGTRRLTNPDSFIDLGCSLVMDECIKCGGFTSAMIRQVREPQIDYRFRSKRWG